MSTNAGAIESSSDALVSSETPSNSDVAVTNEVTAVVGTHSSDSKTETLTTEPCSGGIISAQDLVDDDKVLNRSTSDASYGVKIGADLLESSSGTLIMETSDHNPEGDVVQDPIDDARVSVDETGIVRNDSGLALDKLISDDVVSSESPSNRDIDNVDGVEIGADLVGSETETLTMKPSADHNGGADDSIDNSRVCGDEKGIVINNSELVLDKRISDAVVSSGPLSGIDIEAVSGVKIGADLVGSETETLTMKPSADHNGDGDDAVRDSVDDSRVSGDEKGIVMSKSDLVSDKSISDAVVSSEPVSNSDIDTVNAVDLVGSETETLTMKPSADHDGDGDTAVHDSIDDSRVSGDEKGIVMNNSELVLDKRISDAVVSSEPVSNSDIDTVNGVDLVGSETETLTMKPPADNNGGADTVVQDPIDDSRVSGDEKGIEMNKSDLVSDKSISDAVVSSEPLSGIDIDAVRGVKSVADSLGSKTDTLIMKSSADHNGDGGTVVQDSIDDSRVSEGEKGIVMENIEKVSDEIEVIDEEKEGEYKVTDMVWAKVKNYPWWPAQIFDPSSATDKAKKFSNKKGLLVGYFGDQTFAWNKPSNIKPFRKNFSKLEKQSNSKAYLHAVNCALDEVSRRVEFGLACSCLSREVYDKIKSQDFVNAGIRKEASKIDGGDRFSTVSTFKSVKIVQSVQELAREHFDGFSRLEALSVRTQLLAFFRWKGRNQLKAENILDGLDNTLEDESELPSMEDIKMVEDENTASVGKKVSSKKRKPDVSDSDDSVPRKKDRSYTNVSPKSNSSVKRSKKDTSKKTTVEDNGDEKPASVGKKVSSKKRKPDVSDSDDSVPPKKERSLKNVTPKGKSSVKRSKKDTSKKTTVEDNGNEKPASVGKKVSVKKRKADACDSDDSAPHKKERSFTNMTSKGNSSAKRSKKSISKKATVGDNVLKGESGNGTDDKKSPVSSSKSRFRVGDSICRIAKQISESPSILEKETQKAKNDDNSATLRKTSKKDGQAVEAIQTEE